MKAILAQRQNGEAMMPRKKVHHVLVRVSAPSDLSAAEVRREVRTLINEQANWAADHGDVRAQKVAPAPKALLPRAQ